MERISDVCRATEILRSEEQGPWVQEGTQCAWLKRGFDDGVFLLAGSLQPSLGGGIVAHNTSLADLQTRVKEDPFVAENVVSAEVLDIAVAKADSRLDFLGT